MSPVRSVPGLLLIAGLASAVHAVVLPPSTGPTSFVAIDTPGNPFAGATLLQSVTGPPQSVTSISNISHQPYTQATVSLTTQVYRLAGGNLGFAYTLNSSFFPDTLDSFSHAQVKIPRLSISGFQNHSVDLAANLIPNGSSFGPPAFTAFRTASNNGTITFSFARDTVPAEVPAFYSRFAGTPITLFATTDASAFQPINSVVRLSQRDGRDQTSSGIISDLSFDSFGPVFAATTGHGLPEPLTALTLPLAILALALRRQR
jgi:hypothetical protein